MLSSCQQKICLVILGLLLSTSAFSARVVAEFDGSQSTTTRSFKVNGPWLLTYRIRSDYPSQTAFELGLLDNDKGFYDSRIMKIKYTTSGLKLFNKSGRFSFRVTAEFADWHLKVEQLTQEEADAMVPAK